MLLSWDLFISERKKRRMYERDDVINVYSQKEYIHLEISIDKFRILILKFSFMELIIVLYDL